MSGNKLCTCITSAGTTPNYRPKSGSAGYALQRAQKRAKKGDDERSAIAHEQREMKIDRHGRAKILTQAEIQLLFSSGLESDRDRCLFGICLYTACRIAEACTLRRKDVFDEKRRVRPELIIRKANTKGKLATRTIPVGEDLRLLLNEYNPPSYHWFLFPGRQGKKHIHSDSAARILREACLRVGIEGVSTHSFRRTALTMMSDAGIPLRVIQEVSGHRTLDELQKYLEVRPEQVRGAIASLSMLSHVEKPVYGDLEVMRDRFVPWQKILLDRTRLPASSPTPKRRRWLPPEDRVF